MPSVATFSGRDYGNEVTRCSVNLPVVSAANYDAVAAASVNILAAINNVCQDGPTVLDPFNGRQLNAVQISPSGKSDGPGAQRERKWLVPLIDAINPLGNWSFEIGMADAAHLVTDGEVMDVSGGPGLALVTVLEAECVSRLNNAVTVGPIRLVGRTT